VCGLPWLVTNGLVKPLKLINKEFTFDVDMSQLGCGLNGAVYLSAMPLDGGLSTQPNNKAGAKYGFIYHVACACF
jgi:cellulose 1,4-beta-cellobiosidase